MVLTWAWCDGEGDGDGPRSKVMMAESTLFAYDP